jgi:hypothetical protein
MRDRWVMRVCPHPSREKWIFGDQENHNVLIHHWVKLTLITFLSIIPVITLLRCSAEPPR